MNEAFWIDFIFITCAIFSVTAFLFVVTLKNPIYSVLFLIGGFIPIAIIYFLLNAYFIGIIQILVYAGAIMVLFTFVIMMVDFSKHEYENDKPLVFKILTAIAVFLAILIVLVPIVDLTAGIIGTESITANKDFGTIESIGKLMFAPLEKNYIIISFELVSMLILLAIAGTIVIAKNRKLEE